MKLRDYFELPCKFIIWNKLSSIIFVVFLSLVFLLGHLLINVGYNYDKYVEDSVNKNVLARTYFIFNSDQLAGKSTDLEKIVKDVRKIPHVIHSYNDQYAALMAANIDEINKNNEDKSLFIKTVTDTFSPNISKGRKVKNENEIICPRYLRTSNAAKNKSDVTSMEKYLNKEITLSYVQLYWENASRPLVSKVFEKKVKLVGIFDNILSLETFNECYMLESVVRQMFLESDSIYSEEFLKDNFVYNDGNATEVIVDELKNMDIVKEELTKEGYDVSTVGLNFDWQFINKIKLISLIVFFILLLCILIIFSIYISVFLKKQKKYIALYKIFGYTEKQLSLLYKIQIILYSLISFIISLIICNIGVFITNKILSNNLEYFYVRLSISFYFEFIFFVFIIGIIYLVSNRINKKINSFEIKEIFNDNNF